MNNQNSYDPACDRLLFYFFKGQYLKRKFYIDEKIVDDSIKKYLDFFPNTITDCFNDNGHILSPSDIIDKYLKLCTKIITYNYQLKKGRFQQKFKIDFNTYAHLFYSGRFRMKLDNTIDYLQFILLKKIATNKDKIKSIDPYQNCSVFDYEPDYEDRITLFIFLIVSCKYSLMVSELISPPYIDNDIVCYLDKKALPFMRKLHIQFSELDYNYVSDKFNKLSTYKKNILNSIYDNNYNLVKVDNTLNYLAKEDMKSFHKTSIENRFISLWIYDNLYFTDSNINSSKLLDKIYRLYPNLFNGIADGLFEKDNYYRWVHVTANSILHGDVLAIKFTKK